MNIGLHIPAYLYCEQLANQKRVLDICPVDERGTQLLAKCSKSLVVVQPTRQEHMIWDEDTVHPVVASPDKLPFSRESFHLVYFCAQGKDAQARFSLPEERQVRKEVAVG
jgi:hypothetical protein